MSSISNEKRERIKEELLRIIYENYPNFLYTYQIADLLIRDDEFVLNLLKQLKDKNLIFCLEESSGGNVKRKWQLKREVYEQYKELSA